MSRFVLEGRLGVANALVGTFRKDEQSPDQTVIVALVPENTKPKTFREIREQIIAHAQERFVPWTPGQQELTGLFNRLTEQQLSFTIKDAGPAAAMMDEALAEGKTKNVIYCTNAAAYLSVCSKLGVSKKDMIPIAELSALLPASEKIPALGGIVGQSHKLCERLATGKGREVYKFPAGSPMGNTQVPVGRQLAAAFIHYIQTADKFSGGSMTGAQFRERLGPNVDKIADGLHKLYLPYENCLFEIEVDGKKTFMLAQTRRTGFWAPHGYMLTDEDFYVIPMTMDKNSDVCHIFPYAMVFSIEKGQLRSVKAYTRGGDDKQINDASIEIMQGHLDDGTIRNMADYMLGMLSVFNSPSHHPVKSIVPEALKKSRHKKISGDPTRFPFYDYHVIEVPVAALREEDLTSRDEIRRVASPGGEPGDPTGIHQRWHKRKGYYRDYEDDQGRIERIRIGSYYAGDPNIGIISKSEKARISGSGEDGPAEPNQ